MIDNKQIIVLISPVVVTFFCIIALSYIMAYIKFKPSLSPAEQELLGFSYQKTQIIQRQPITVPAIDSPIRVEVVPPKVDYPQVPLVKVVPPELQEKPQVEMKVSFILINGGRKMAIINGMVVKEGDVFNQNRVAKIEKNKVLIIDKVGERWIGVE
jgi:hypothetical protein